MSSDSKTDKKDGGFIYFYDTCSLLRLQEEAFKEPFKISAQTLLELEEIKTSAHKDEEIKWRARNLVRLLEKHRESGTYEVVLAVPEWSLSELGYNVELEWGDQVIIEAALRSGLEFYTDDLLCRLIASMIGCKIHTPEETQEKDRYSGYITVAMSDDEMSYFYSHTGENIYGLQVNQYLRVLNTNNELVDKLRWNGEMHVPLYDRGIKSVAFGTKLKPRDEFQAMAVDSIMNNTLTVLTGKAGSGKTLMALATIFTMIEKGTYDRVVIFTNPCKVRGASDMGFYTGDMVKKAMQNSIGNILITKFGDRYIVDQMLAQEKIKIVSIADCRGMEIRDNEILFLSEAQNASIDMVKLLLTRASSECKIVLEGDTEAQVDSHVFEGRNNGLKRIIERFKGEKLFGYVDLPNVWRSKLAELAEKL